jgi:hypothetical protein
MGVSDWLHAAVALHPGSVVSEPQNKSQISDFTAERNCLPGRNQNLIAQPITSNYNERAIPALVIWYIIRIFWEPGSKPVRRVHCEGCSEKWPHCLAASTHKPQCQWETSESATFRAPPTEKALVLWRLFCTTYGKLLERSIWSCVN